MAYVYLPARETNFYPPGPPYLAGLRGMRGLGDYASDLAAYKADMTQWRLESLAYERTIKANAARVKKIDAAYAAALASYAADKAAWNKEYASYLVAANSWQAASRANATRSKKIAEAYGLNLPQSYYQSGACLTQAQHDEYARQCTTVRGLGRLRGLGASDPDCGMKALPICTPAPTIRAKPVPPTKPVYPAEPKLRAMPIAPTAPAVTTPTSSGGGSGSGGGGSPTTHLDPVSLPVTDPGASLTPEVAEESKQANVLMGGLIVAAVAVGGYLVYRTLRKPKAAA